MDSSVLARASLPRTQDEWVADAHLSPTVWWWKLHTLRDAAHTAQDHFVTELVIRDLRPHDLTIAPDRKVHHEPPLELGMLMQLPRETEPELVSGP